MDLIYAMADKTDIGVLHDYDFDLAYGRDENDFALTIDRKKHCCSDDYLIYMVDTDGGTEEPTEYGGIIDKITVDTTAGTVTYSGRTWHGILSKKIIEPEPGQDYYIGQGNANDIIQGLINSVGLEWIFRVDGQSVIEIGRYEFARYTDVYSGICKMLSVFGGKLQVRYENKMVVLNAVWKVDYSQDEEFDSTQVDFTVSQTKNPVNHLICLGTGSLKDRHIIHLFTDSGGGIQPYALTETPIKDDDYILDKRNQQFTGQNEVCMTYDFSSAADTENFVPMSTQPADWWKNYSDYYTLGDDGQYTEVEGVETETLTLVSSVLPSTWAAKYMNYYTSDGKSVEGVETTNYVALTEKPSDWDKNWNQYFVHFWDGTQWKWNGIGTVTRTHYVKQTKKPSDWDNNFGVYYTLGKIELKTKAEIAAAKKANPKAVKTDAKTKKTIGIGFVRVDKVKKGNKLVTPTWKKNKYYTAYSESYAPAFTSGLNPKYRLDKTVTAPAWAANTYYTKTAVVNAPVWKSGAYYKRYVDHYAELVKYGIEKLQEETTAGDSVHINLSLMGEYDIGDIVGATEQVTGVSVWQDITKKIVSIKSGKKSISYQIGVTV